jgi:hypothetical protein
VPLISSTLTRAATVNLVIEQGTDFSHTVSLQNSDGTVFVLTGYSAKMQIRPNLGSATLHLELSTANGRIVPNALAGQLTLSLSNAVTSALTFRSAVYDLEITSGAGVVTRVMQGNVTLSLEVTQ